MDSTIKFGMSGALVREAQGLLNSYFGKVKVNPTGVFVSETSLAVKEFQKKLGLAVDGVIGPHTWKALRAHGAMHTSSPPPIFDFFDVRAHEAFLKKLPSARQTRAKPHNYVEKPELARPSLPKPGDTDQYSPSPDTPDIFSNKDWRNYSRTGFDGFEGRSYVITEFMKFQGAAIELLPQRRLLGPGDKDRFKINNQCAHFVQYFGLPRASQWLRGPRVCDFKSGELARGTVIATLRDGKYHNDSSGRSHVGIYLSHTDYAEYLKNKNNRGHIWMFDQYKGVALGCRQKFYIPTEDVESSSKTRSWTDAAGKTRDRRVQWVNDGEEYYVLLSNEE